MSTKASIKQKLTRVCLQLKQIQDIEPSLNYSGYDDNFSDVISFFFEDIERANSELQEILR